MENPDVDATTLNVELPKACNPAQLGQPGNPGPGLPMNARAAALLRARHMHMPPVPELHLRRRMPIYAHAHAHVHQRAPIPGPAGMRALHHMAAAQAEQPAVFGHFHFHQFNFAPPNFMPPQMGLVQRMVENNVMIDQAMPVPPPRNIRRINPHAHLPADAQPHPMQHHAPPPQFLPAALPPQEQRAARPLTRAQLAQHQRHMEQLQLEQRAAQAAAQVEAERRRQVLLPARRRRGRRPPAPNPAGGIAGEALQNGRVHG